MGPPCLGPEKNFQNRSSHTAGKRYFEFESCKQQSHLLIFQAESTENVLDILSYSESTIRPTMVGPGEKFSKWRLSEAWKTLLYDRFLRMQ